MEYKLNWVERKTTSTGKQKIDATLDTPTGQERGITIWSDFPDFANLAAGRTVNGTITTSKDGKWKSLQASESKSFPQRSPSAISKAMDKKEASIEKFQDSKQDSIQKAAIIRDSTILTAAQTQGHNLDVEAMKLLWEGWNDFLTAKWTQPF